jgi:quercetin dioxygenase-like cupin family protein
MPAVFIRASDVPTYRPDVHTGTVNRRLVGVEHGARSLEIVLGELQEGHGASAHLHPNLEQVCYVLDGALEVEAEGSPPRILVAGDACFFPKNLRHRVEAKGGQARILVIYGPPYDENPLEMVR